MDANKLQTVMDSDSFREVVNNHWEDFHGTAWFMDNITLTPSGQHLSENLGANLYGSERQAVIADKRQSALIFGSMVNVFPAMFGAMGLEALIGGSAWVGLPTFALIAFFIPFFAARFSRNLVGESHSVSHVMMAAWSKARKVLEAANDENTVPAILEHLSMLEAEVRAIYTTYSDLISPVDREQAETDFVVACSTIMTLENVATQARNALYSSRRQQYSVLEASNV